MGAGLLRWLTRQRRFQLWTALWALVLAIFWFTDPAVTAWGWTIGCLWAGVAMVTLVLSAPNAYRLDKSQSGQTPRRSAGVME